MKPLYVFYLLKSVPIFSFRKLSQFLMKTHTLDKKVPLKTIKDKIQNFFMDTSYIFTQKNSHKQQISYGDL